MKDKLKTLSLIVLLGSLFYFISSYAKSKLIANSPKNETILVNEIENILKKTAPKVYISTPPVQNGLEVGSNWKSR
jgi:hypothetical protein